MSQGCNTGLDHRSTVEGRSREVYSTVHCLSHPNERLPTSTVKEPIFLLTKLKTRDSVWLCSDPRVVFSVADVLACHRETRWYCTQITLALSSLLQTLACYQQTRDRRFSADCRVVFSFVAALAYHRQTRQFSADARLLIKADACAVGGVHSFFSLTLSCPFPFLIQVNLTVEFLVTV